MPWRAKALSGVAVGLRLSLGSSWCSYRTAEADTPVLVTTY